MSDNVPGRPTVPVGGILRALPGLPGWLRAILNFVRGVRVPVGGVDIELDQNQGPAAPGRSAFDSKPHEPGPVDFGPGPRR